MTEVPPKTAMASQLCPASWRVKRPAPRRSCAARTCYVELCRITPDLLAYGKDDVKATSQLYFACLDELARHEGIRLDAHRLYSPATIGTQYLIAMGYQRPLEQFTNMTHEELGWTTLPPAAPR